MIVKNILFSNYWVMVRSIEPAELLSKAGELSIPIVSFLTSFGEKVIFFIPFGELGISFDILFSSPVNVEVKVCATVEVKVKVVDVIIPIAIVAITKILNLFTNNIRFYSLNRG
jgi:hypothetical protein